MTRQVCDAMMLDGVFARKHDLPQRHSKHNEAELLETVCFTKQLQFQKAISAVTKYQDAAVSATAPQSKALSGR